MLINEKNLVKLKKKKSNPPEDWLHQFPVFIDVMLHHVMNSMVVQGESVP